MPDAGDPYHSAPLLPGSRAARFLQFRSDGDGNIVGTLHVHDVDEKGVSWIALSYTWKSFNEIDDQTFHSISIDGVVLPIGTNLWRALTALLDQRSMKAAPAAPRTSYDWRDWYCEAPRMDEDTYFWIDAICVDQNNTRERNHQVGLMRDVYSRASLVISWMTPSVGFDWSDMTGSIYTPPDDFKGLDYAETQVVLNPYWDRMWIIQECVLPRTNLLLSEGAWIVPHKIPSWTLQKNPNMWSVVRSRMRLHGIHFEKDETEPSLLSLALEFRYHQCADPRDKIYALLGLKTKRHSIEADYARSPLELFVDFAIAEIDFHSEVRRMSQIIDLAGALGLDLSLPIIYCLCIIPYHSFMLVPWYSSTSTVEAGTDWLIRTEDGQRALRQYTAASIHKMSKRLAFEDLPEDDGEFRNRDSETHQQLETLRESKGIDADHFRKILKALAMQEAEDHSSDSDFSAYAKVMKRGRLEKSKAG